MGHIHAPSSLPPGSGRPPADPHCPDIQGHQSQPKTKPVGDQEMQKDTHKPVRPGRPLTSARLSLHMWPHLAQAEGAKLTHSAGLSHQVLGLEGLAGILSKLWPEEMPLSGPQMRQEFKAGLMELEERLLPKPLDPTFQGPGGPQASPCSTGYRPWLHLSSAR